MTKCQRKIRFLTSIYISCALLLLGFASTPSMATTFQVNSNLDANDLTPGNDLCVAFVVISPPFVFPFCTLRGAIEEANSLAGPDTIILPPGLFSISIDGGGEDAASTGDLDITDDLIIQGAGELQTIIDGSQIDRIFDIPSPGTTVTLQNLTLMNGQPPDIQANDKHGGGAIRNRGILILDKMVLLNHSVNSTTMEGFGGILFNEGVTDISGATFQSGSAGRGGAIYNSAGSQLEIRSSTISHSSADSGAGVSNQGELILLNSTLSNNGSSVTSLGGGLENMGVATIQHVTLAFNRALDGGGISSIGSTSVQNSIIASNLGGDCAVGSSILSLGANLDSDNSCLLNDDSDREGVDPQLEPLRNNGGNNMTHLAAPLSPVRDAAVLLPGIRVDQRGVVRPLGDGVDIGSVENSPFALPPLLTPLL